MRGADLKNEAGPGQTIRNQREFIVVTRNETVQRPMTEAGGCCNKTVTAQQEGLTQGFPGGRRAPCMLMLL